MTDEIIKCIDCKYLDQWRSVEAAKKFGPGYVCRRGILNIISESDYCSKAEKKQKTTGTWILHADDLSQVKAHRNVIIVTTISHFQSMTVSVRTAGSR